MSRACSVALSVSHVLVLMRSRRGGIVSLRPRHPSVLRAGVAAHIPCYWPPGNRLMHLMGVSLHMMGRLRHHAHLSIPSHVVWHTAPGLGSCHPRASHLVPSHPILPKLVVHLWLVLLHPVVHLLAPGHSRPEGRLLWVRLNRCWLAINWTGLDWC